jgi:hypothetical protein
MKLLLCFFAFTFTYSSFAYVLNYDQIREEVKQLATDNHSPHHGYSKARKILMQEIHLRQDAKGYFVQDVYCKIKFRKSVGPGKMPSHTKINIEHTWPRSRFGVSKRSSKFKLMEADLHHLYPSDSVTNSRRSNHEFTQFKGNSSGIEDCPISKVGYIPSTRSEGFEPPINHKGNVARALFYMAVRYDLRISDQEEFFLKQWNIIDPVDADEILRNEQIQAVQGNSNPFVNDPELVDLISDY